MLFDFYDASNESVKDEVAERLALQLFDLIHTGELSYDYTETVRQFLNKIRQMIKGDPELANLIKTHLMLIAAEKINALCDQYESSDPKELGRFVE